MKIILLKDIRGLGRRYEEKNVSDGHAINYLIPKKLAVRVGTNSAKQIEDLKKSEEAKNAKSREALQINIQNIKDKTIETTEKANDKGHLFASLNKEKIMSLLKTQGIDIDPELLSLEKPIKEIGEFRIPIRVGEKDVHFTLVIRPQK